MPHESTVNPEEPMHFKSWGDEISPSELLDRRRSTISQITSGIPRRLNSTSIQTHPDLPLHVTHDHDDDGDDDDHDQPSGFDPDGDFEHRSRITYTPPKRKIDNGNAKDQQTSEN